MTRIRFLAVLWALLTAFLFAEGAPAVTLTAPAPSASFTLPVTVTLAATASASDGTITKVEFFNGTVKVGETAVSPYELSWSPTNPGLATLTAVATDNLGGTATSSPVAITLLPGLPYTAGFEASEGYVLGSLNNQLGWSVSAGTAQVVSGTAAQGTQYVNFSPGTAAAVADQEFGSAAGNPAVAFIDFYAKPVAGSDTDTGTLFDLDAARVSCVLNGATGQLRALDGDGLGSGVWTTLRTALALDVNNVAATWQHLTIRLNYTAKTYDLYLDGVMIAADLKFRLNSATYVSWFSVKGHTAASASLDDLYAGPTNPLFADVNNNGLDDAWETAHGLSLSADNRNADPDGDGLTNLQEYIAGSDPRDYYNGSELVMASLVDPSGYPRASGLVSVKVTRSSDGAALVNAPVTLSVTTGASQIASTAGGAMTASISVRTDAAGIAAGYVTFSTASADTLVAAATSGGITATLSIVLNPIVLPTAGMRLRLSADGLGLTDGATVATWTDSSGMGNNATQAAIGSRPVYVAGALNGHGVVRFDGSDDYLSLPNLMNGATAGEVFVVWQSAIASGSYRRPWTLGTSGSYTYYPQSDGSISDNFGSTSAWSMGAPAQAITSYHLYRACPKFADLLK